MGWKFILFHAAGNAVRNLPPGRISEQLMLTMRYYRQFRRLPNLRNPVTFSEKMQRRKLFDRNPELTLLQDKYRVRDYVSRRIGTGYLVPLLQMHEDPSAIDFESLPRGFVMKANHGCGWNRIVRDIRTEDVGELRRLASEWLDLNYYSLNREWAYKDIPPRILFEELITDDKGDPHPMDFKVCCFDGVPRYFVVFRGRDTDHFSAWRYKVEQGRLVPVELTVPLGHGREIFLRKDEPGVPEDVTGRILELAAELAHGNDHLRTDFYVADGRILFGEMTLYFGSGFVRYKPPEFDRWLGGWWNQPY